MATALRELAALGLPGLLALAFVLTGYARLLYQGYGWLALQALTRRFFQATPASVQVFVTDVLRAKAGTDRSLHHRYLEAQGSAYEGLLDLAARGGTLAARRASTWGLPPVESHPASLLAQAEAVTHRPLSFTSSPSIPGTISTPW